MIDRKVWVNGVEKDSMSGEGHQNQYYQDSPTPEELNSKVQQLADSAKVKEKRIREVLKAMPKKYGKLFMTKLMKTAGTAKKNVWH